MTLLADLIPQLRTKEFRQAYVSEGLVLYLAAQIKKLRKNKGWSRKHLASLVPLSSQQITDIENLEDGVGYLTIDTLLSLADVFDIALDIRFVSFSTLVEQWDGTVFQNPPPINFHSDLPRLETLASLQKKREHK
jgi:transcriptional regulator with XRE-family HTH domain